MNEVDSDIKIFDKSKRDRDTSSLLENKQNVSSTISNSMSSQLNATASTVFPYEEFALKLCEDDFQGDNVSWPFYASSELFQFIVEDVKMAIRQGIEPIRIKKGSSGSYFVRNTKGQVVGVFKPKNEEPYGNLNPKWTKWLHKTCLPCCFGRSCLIPNLGYISEASASIVDRHLKFHIVPRTEVVELSSSSFYYNILDKRNAKTKGFPLKIGSFQLFLNGFKDASSLLKTFVTNPLSESEQKIFQHQFERLVLLDYIIRNTDRGDDNWMIWKNTEQKDGLYIGAIDHGLAFPFKHPDNWRSYPYSWLYLPAAKRPFSEDTIKTYLSILQENCIIENMIADLCSVAKRDSDFDAKRFSHQISVMKGQIYNVIETLKDKGSPYDLVSKPLLTIFDEKDPPNSEYLADKAARLVKFVKAQPCFKNW